MKRETEFITGIITDRVVCRMPGAEIVIERVDDDSYFINIPLRGGRELYLFGGEDGDLTLDLHPRGEDSCCLATFDEVAVLIGGDHADATAHDNPTQSSHKRSATKARRSR